MWRAREKERELDAKLKSRAKDKDVHYGENRGDSHKKVTRHEEEACRSSTFTSTSKHGRDEDTCYSSEGGGLKGDEVEEFLRSRAKRGRGAIGSRMDEPGPYPSAISLDRNGGKLLAEPDTREKEEWERRILGPEKPGFIKSRELSPEEVRDKDSSNKKHHSKDNNKKKRPKEERSERRKNKEKKKSKHTP